MPNSHRSIVRGIVAAAVAALIVIFAVACAQAPQTQDRGGVSGAPVDLVRDVDYNIIFRNSDDLPNIAMTCIQGAAFASGTTGRAQGEGGTAGATPIIRVEAWDSTCAQHRKGA